jgi:protein-tyrosine phosphatase
LNEAASKALGGVDASYLDAGFAAMRDSHGSVDAYLADVLGVDAAVQDRIREAFVER